MKGTLNKPATIIKKDVWPELPLNQWEETYSTVHLWTQVIGKIKLEFSEFINHWWNVTFFPTTSGLSTGIIPYKNTTFEMEFNFLNHHLVIKMDNGKKELIKLQSGTISEFYEEVKEKLKTLGIKIHIWTVPVEIDDRLPFDKDHRPRVYDPEFAQRYWKALVQVNKVMKLFRSGFTGKASPVQFFWGSLDIAVTFFSGKPAPEHPGAPNIGRKVMVESYNSELASFGFWAGKGIGEAAFYAYAYPEPENYKDFTIEPSAAYYNDTFREFILPYSAVKNSVELSNWDRSLYKI